jgi:ankyrin repeat protein
MAVAKSQSEVETVKREIEGLRAELSRITQLNDQYRNEMLSRLTERLETRATQLEEEIKGRFYNRLKLIVWGATTLFLLGTAFGWWNVTSTIPKQVYQEVTNKVAEETEGISSRIMEKLETKLDRNVEKAVKERLKPLEDRVEELNKIADSVEPILLPKRLLDASRAGDADRVKSLLKQGVEIDVKDSEGRTPLMLAAMGGHVDVVEALISSSAAVDDQDNLGKTALWYASSNGFVEVVKKLLEAGGVLELENRDGATPLIAAVSADKDEVVYVLLKSGANVNTRWEKQGGQTPLIEATYNGNTAIVELLLRSGAKVGEKRRIPEETALDVATRFGREEIRELLEKAGEAS